MKITYKTNIREEGETVVIELIGKLNSDACSIAEKDVAPIVGRDDCDIVVDCAQLDYICSRGLRLLLLIYKHTRDVERKATLINYNEDIGEVFRMSGFLRLYRVE